MFLLYTLLLPAASAPLIYLIGERSPRKSALAVVFSSTVDLSLLLLTLPTVLSEGRYVESYYWMPMLGSPLTLFIDGVSLPMAVITLILIISSALFSVDYMAEQKLLREYYSLLALLTVGLVGVFITSNLMVFYFCWEFMLIPAYFIIGGWGYKDSYRAAFKFFVFTHAGAVAILLGMGSIYMLTGTLDMFQARGLLSTTSQDVLLWVLAAFTFGFAVKMAIVPLHMWLPDAHAEAPAPISSLLSGVIIEAGAYAILRVSFGMILPSLSASISRQFLYVLSILGVISTFYGAMTALAENDIKRIVAYSSISHMGYVLFGLSLFPLLEGVVGSVLHLVNHAASKGLLFLNAGAVMRQTGLRDIREMGGLASKIPLVAVLTAISSFSIAGIPAFACFISEFLIFLGGFQVGVVDNFYYGTTTLMVSATVLSLAYILRFYWRVFLGSPRVKEVKDTPPFMTAAMILLSVIVVILGVWPGPLIELISNVEFG